MIPCNTDFGDFPDSPEAGTSPSQARGCKFGRAGASLRLMATPEHKWQGRYVTNSTRAKNVKINITEKHGELCEEQLIFPKNIGKYGQYQLLSGRDNFIVIYGTWEA